MCFFLLINLSKLIVFVSEIPEAHFLLFFENADDVFDQEFIESCRALSKELNVIVERVAELLEVFNSIELLLLQVLSQVVLFYSLLITRL